MYFVGIDWADTKHDILVMSGDGKELDNFTIQHSKDGFETLQTKLLKHDDNPENFYCLIETKHGLLTQYLLENNFTVYSVNPKLVDARRKASGAKTDFIDAKILANMGRSELHDLHKLEPDSEHIQQLKVLTRDQDALIQESTRLTNRLISTLKEYYPVALELFSKITLPISLAFLRKYPTLKQAREASRDDIYKFLKKQNHPNPTAKANDIFKKLQKPNLEGNRAICSAKSKFLFTILDQLEPLLEHINEYDKEIEKLFKSHSDSKIFETLPGAGKRIAPRLLAEWGDDRSRYDEASVVQALAGTSPVLHQSGKMRIVKRRHSCIKPFRNALHQFALQTTRWISWAKDYYYKKRKEGKQHHEAVRALANIWVRILFAMWVNKEPYNESKFIKAREKHAA